MDNLRGNEKFNEKIFGLKKIFNKICSEKPCYIGKEIQFNDELSLEFYNSLNKELLQEKDNYIQKFVEIITFIRFIDIINLKQNIFHELRKHLIECQCNSVLDELNSEDFLQKKSSNKKHKKKKKKSEKESPKERNKNNKEDDKKNQNLKKTDPQPIKIIYDVQTKEIECKM